MKEKLRDLPSGKKSNKGGNRNKNQVGMPNRKERSK